MLKLYYAPGTCALASHIALEEAGASYQTQRLDFARGEQRSPEYLAVNPHGRVPALSVDGRVLTESPAILAYIADRHPGAGLLPQDDIVARAHVLSRLAFFAASVHVAFAHIFRPERFGPPDTADAVKAKGRETVLGYLDEIEAMLADSDFVAGPALSVADFYPLVFHRWGAKQGIDMHAYPGWTRHVWRLLDRPAVERAIVAEDLPRTDWVALA